MKKDISDMELNLIDYLDKCKNHELVEIRNMIKRMSYSTEKEINIRLSKV